MLKRWLYIVLGIIVVSGAYGFYHYRSLNQQVRDTVTGYNNALIQALRRPDPEIMKRWTGQKENERITMYIVFLYGKNQKIEAKLTSFKFTGTDVNGRTAKVTTEEFWDNQYLDVKTGQPVGDKEKFHYQGNYQLEKDNAGKWIVTELDTKEIK